MTFTSCLVGALLGVSALLRLGTEVQAAERYPDRLIRVIVPTPPGGGADTLARLTADAAESILHTRIIVENRPGAGGTIGTALVTRASPDGYTLGFIFNGPLTTLPNTKKDVPYTPDSYVPIIGIGYSSYVMCVAPDFPANNAKEFIEQLKLSPNKYTYGNDGLGNTMQLAAERIFEHFGIKQTAIPFGGAGETTQNFLGHHIDIYGGSIQPMLPHMKSGAAKCLLLTSGSDNPQVPQASGLDAVGAKGLDTGLWWGLIGPKGLTPEIVDTLYRAYLEAAHSLSVTAALERAGASPVTRDPKEMRELISREYSGLHQVAEHLGLTRP
jgi:tripartite-type tricarboxylate transporter receptor subunit TctC